MLAKVWKNVCIAILVFACLFNVVSKLVHKVSFNTEILSSARYMYNEYKYEKEENVIK